MNKKIFATASTTFLLAMTLACSAQPGNPGPRPPMGPGQVPPPPPGRNEPLRQVTSFSGQVGEWVANYDFIYDGFYLQNNGQKTLVKFPARMGTQLKTAAKTGSTISFNGVQDSGRNAEKTIRLVSITLNGQTTYETPPAPPTLNTSEESATGTSKIISLQKNDMGDITGFVLENKTILKVPPHVAKQLAQTAVAGTSLGYNGMKKVAGSGEVSSANYTIVHCQTITINGTQYLTR